MADFGKPCMALYKVTDPCQYTRLFNRHRLTKNIFPKASSPLPSDDVKNVHLNKRVLHNKCYVILYKRWHHSEIFTHTCTHHMLHSKYQIQTAQHIIAVAADM